MHIKLNIKSKLISLLIVSNFAIVIAQPAPRKVPKVPKNVIFMISDGCGINHIRATNLYQYGEYEAQSYEKFPVKLFMSTYPAKIKIANMYFPVKPYSTFEAWNDFRYVLNDFTGSAASGTALATGSKTYNGAIGVDIHQNNLKNLCELAIEKQKSAGVISSVQFAHATPASFSAHNTNRSNYSEIAKDMLIESKLCVIMGCGNPNYDNSGNKLTKANSFKYVGDSLIWNDLLKNSSTLNGKLVQDIDFNATADKWNLIQDKKDFVALAEGKNLPNRVLGVPKVWQTLQQEKDLNITDYYANNHITNNEDPNELIKNQISTVPDLEIMAQGALNVLNQNANGFFLMIEGGAIDWAAHSNQTARMITEQIYFNNTVDKVIEWIEKNSSWEETLLIITADHETGYITAPYKGDKNTDWDLIPKSEKGKLPNIQWNSNDHTNSLVPFFAKGICSEYFNIFADEYDIKRGKYLNNTEPAQLIFLLWK